MYETDFVSWTEQTARLIRDGKFEQVDWEHVIEEIESLGRSDRRELKSRLEVLFNHLLKWEYQPDSRSGSWKGTMNEQRNRIRDLLLDSPSLKPYLDEILSECYQRGRRAASDETELPLDAFPAECPYTLEQSLNSDFFPKVE
jgi:hypothetical protein